MSQDTPKLGYSNQQDDQEMQETQDSFQQPSVQPFQASQSPSTAQFKIAVNLMPPSKASCVESVCDAALTESQSIKNFGQL